MQKAILQEKIFYTEQGLQHFYTLQFEKFLGLFWSKEIFKTFYQLVKEIYGHKDNSHCSHPSGFKLEPNFKTGVILFKQVKFSTDTPYHHSYSNWHPAKLSVRLLQIIEQNHLQLELVIQESTIYDNLNPLPST
jgi:hypothetical protein